MLLAKSLTLRGYAWCALREHCVKGLCVRVCVCSCRATGTVLLLDTSNEIPTQLYQYSLRTQGHIYTHATAILH